MEIIPNNYFLFSSEKSSRPVSEKKSFNKAIEMIEQAKSPLLLVGAGANRNQVSQKLLEFLEKTQMPYSNTQMGKGAITKNPFYIGTAATSENSHVHEAFKCADLIINVGHDIIEKPPFFMTSNSQTVIHINYSAARVDEIYFPQHEVIGDIANTIKQLTHRIVKQTHWNFTKASEVRKELLDRIENSKNSKEFPLLPQRIISDVNEVFSEEGYVCLDNGMYKIWFASFYRTVRSNGLLLDNALATMGAGLPSAIATKLIYPNQPVLAVCGDGGFMMNSQELETAVRLNLNLIVLILNDFGYGMIKWKQQRSGFADFGLDFNNPDFVKYADSYGAYGYRLKSAEELLPLLEKCTKSSGVHVIDVPIKYPTEADF